VFNINGALSTPGYMFLLALSFFLSWVVPFVITGLKLLWELWKCTRGFTEFTVLKQVRKTILTCCLFQFKKSFGKSVITVRT